MAPSVAPSPLTECRCCGSGFRKQAALAHAKARKRTRRHTPPRPGREPEPATRRRKQRRFQTRSGSATNQFPRRRGEAGRSADRWHVTCDDSRYKLPYEQLPASPRPGRPADPREACTGRAGVGEGPRMAADGRGPRGRKIHFHSPRRCECAALDGAMAPRCCALVGGGVITTKGRPRGARWRPPRPPRPPRPHSASPV